MNIRFGSVIRGKCPACHKGSIMKNPFMIRPKCPACGYDFNPENGFYLGAMALSFFITAMLTVPPMVALKLLNADPAIIIAFPFIEFLVLGTFLNFYSRIFWLHLQHVWFKHLDEKSPRR